MTATAIREGARVAVLIIVLVAAAALGLVVGNALQGRSTAAVGAQAPEAAAGRGAPSYADPYRQIIRRAALAADDRHFLRRQAPTERVDASINDATVTAPAPR